MRFIYAEYNMYHNSVDVTTFDGYILRIDCNVAEDRLQTTPRSQCALDALAIDEPLGKRQIIGVYKRSAAYDIVQLEHLDNLNSRLKIIHCSQSFDFSNFLQNSV